MSSASKVGEIFTAAGTAFTKLGELTMQLNSSSSDGSSSKWTEEDISLMHNCLTKFANDIDEISNRVRFRTMAQINAAVKQKEFEDAGLLLSSSSPQSLHSSSVILTSTHSNLGRSSMKANNRKVGKKSTGVSPVSSSTVELTPASPHLHTVSPPPHSQEVTLNMLNASDADSDLKMDFDSSNSS